MSRHTSFQFRGEREGRVAQMSRQEEVIARKRQELLERQKTSELAKQVAAAQSNTALDPAAPTPTSQPIVNAASDIKHPLNLPKQTFETEPPRPTNTFTNDGSFFENFRKITEAAKKAEEEKQKLEAERLAKERELQKAQDKKASEQMMPPQLMPPMDAAFSTNSMPMGPPLMKDPNILHQNLTSFLNLGAPPPPPPPAPPVVVVNEPEFQNVIQPISVQPPPPPPQFVMQNIQQQPPFEGNNYLNENQNIRNYGNIDQMERNVTNKQQVNSLQPLNSEMGAPTNIAALKSPIPTTIDGLIEYIAKNGDDFEEKIVSKIALMNERTLFRFLNDKQSENYRIYREKVLNYRAQQLGQPCSKQDIGDKYDPEDVLHDDDDDIDIAAQQKVEFENSDEYDSDSEYMHETMERNLENMKRRIDSGSKKRSADTGDYSSDECDHTDEEDHMEMYRKIQMRESALSDEVDELSHEQNQNQNQRQRQQQPEINIDRRQNNSKNRKKRSRWGEQVESRPQQQQQISGPSTSNNPFHGKRPAPKLSGITRTDPALLNYARQNYGTTDMSEEDWRKCEEHFKVNLLYQDMLRKRDELDRLAKSGKHKYEYDSDEDITGGTWEHKIRNAEMEATAAWADALTKQSEGKHHIGDFLPPEELKKFMEIYKSKQTNREPDLSDYKEYKLKEDNKGFQMLQKLGWTEGQGLGTEGQGIINPVNKATQRDSNQGLGIAGVTPEAGDNEYDAYRKRMMLAYRFRPNPLNNPRRAYY